MIKELQLRLRPTFDGSKSQKGLAQHSKVLRDIHKEIGATGKTQSKVLSDAERGMQRVDRAAASMGRGLKSAWEHAATGAEKFSKGIDKIKDKLLNFKTFVAGGLIGGLAIEGVKKALDAGTSTIKAKGRIQREFGQDSAAITARALLLARQAGISKEDALNAVIPIGEAVQETQAGTRFRGRALSAGGAAKIRAQTFGFGADLLSRIATVTGEDPAVVGQLLAEAGSGPEGIRRFAGSLGLNRVFARHVAAANAKGRLFDLLGADKAKALGIQRGKVAGQGTVLDVLLQQSGITEEAAAAKRKTFGFQKQAIGAEFGNILGDIGERALDKLNGNLGKGKTLAEKFHDAIASPKGQEAINKIATGIERFVDGVIKVSEKLPKILEFVDKHKTGLIATGGALAALKLVGSARGALGSIPGAGLVANKVLGDAAAIPVRVVNMGNFGAGAGGLPGSIGGAVKTALMGGLGGLAAPIGLAVGAAVLAGIALYIDPQGRKALKGLPTLFESGDKTLGRTEDINRTRGELDRAEKEKVRIGGHLFTPKQVAAAAAVGGSSDLPFLPGSSAGISNPNAPVNITMQMDGHTVAKVLAPHLGRQIMNQTGGGVAPMSRP